MLSPMTIDLNYLFLLDKLKDFLSITANEKL